MLSVLDGFWLALGQIMAEAALALAVLAAFAVFVGALWVLDRLFP